MGISIMDVLAKRSGSRLSSVVGGPSSGGAAGAGYDSRPSSVAHVLRPGLWNRAEEGWSLEALECRIGEIWEEVLGVRRIPHNLDYWEMGRGGRRLLAILERIREESGLDLPLSAVYEAPTIESFARWIFEGRTTTFSPLVLLKAGRSDQPPLFIVCGLSGLALELFPTGRAINHAGPIYAIQPRGFTDEERLYHTVDEMVDHYLEVIREVQPHGPYLIAGYSAGGYAAIEMARKLEAAGEPVPFLGLIDSHPFEGYWPFHIWLDFMLRHAARTIGRGLSAGFIKENKIREVSGTRGASCVRNDAKRPDSAPSFGKISQFIQRFTIRFSDPRSPGYATRFSYYTRGLPAAIQRVTDNGFVLVGTYRPSAYDRKIVFFKSESGDDAQCDPVIVWSKYYPHLEVRVTPGDHRSMLHGSNAAALALDMSECIARETRSRHRRTEEEHRAASV